MVLFSEPVRKTKKTGYQKRMRIGLVDESAGGKGMTSV